MNFVERLKANKAKAPTAAFHEAAHLIAALHFDCAIGDQGIFVRWNGDGVWGFTDVRTGMNATIGEMYRNNPAELVRYQAGNFIGPFAECYYYTQRISPGSNPEDELLAILNNHVSVWLNDFAAALCIELKKFAPGKAHVTEEQFALLERFMRKCFILWLGNDETQALYKDMPLAVETGEDGDIDTSDVVRDAIKMASHLLDVYEPEIEALSAALQTCGYRMTPEQIHDWAAKNFTKKNESEVSQAGK